MLIQDAEHLENLLDDRNEIIKQIEAKNEDTTEIEMSYPENAFEGFVGKSHKAREVKYMAYKASKNRFNVIITGESGTGKSKLAREIHLMGESRRSLCGGQLQRHCTDSFESELFGYVGGAFTGAKTEGKVGF